MRSLDKARDLIASNYGRAHGWSIELEGRVVGELEDPQWEDMFWYSYAVKGELGSTSPLRDDDLWSQCRFAYRNRRTGELVTGAFCGGSAPFVRDGRVLMRGLYLGPRSRSEVFWLWVLCALPPRWQRR